MTMSMTDLITGVTRPGSGGGSCIDHIITNCTIVSHLGILSDLFSDHLPVYACRKKTKTASVPCEFYGRSYRNYSKTDLKEHLLYSDWGDFYNSNKWNMIVSHIIEYLDVSCPLKLMKFAKKKEDWLNNEILELIYERREVMKEFEKKKNHMLLEQGKSLRNRIQARIKSAKADYIKGQLEHCKNDPKKFWREINALLKPGNSHLIPGFVDQTSGLNVPTDECAHYVNSFFASIGQDLFKVFGDHNNTDNILTNLPPAYTCTGSGPIIIDGILVLDLLQSIDTSKSSGVEGINSVVLKDALIYLLPEVVELFRCSLNNGIFPTAWSAANVIPIPKIGDLTDINNWRPISLLPVPGKILEKIVHNHIIKYLESNNILANTQFGFRPGRGTSDAVFKFVNSLYLNRDAGLITAVCYIDFKKAFDSVHHVRLLEKVKLLGIHISILKWLGSYLSSCTQRVLLNSVKSPYLPVEFGVPQGSILGPLLFIIYLNDLTKSVQECDLQAYADDIELQSSNDDTIRAQATLQSDIDRIGVWCQQNYLTVNTKKTKFGWYGTQRQIENAPELKILYNGSLLPTTDCYNYLGIKVDRTLSFKRQISSTIKLVNNKLFKLAKLRPLLTELAAIQIYKQTILPILEYCSFLVDGFLVADQKKIQRLQNRGLRICTLTRPGPANLDLLHIRCSVDYLENRRIRPLKCLMLKYVQQINLPGNPNQRTRGRPIKSRKPKFEFYKRSPLYRGTILWNNIPSHSQLLNTLIEFKKAIN